MLADTGILAAPARARPVSVGEAAVTLVRATGDGRDSRGRWGPGQLRERSGRPAGRERRAERERRVLSWQQTAEWVRTGTRAARLATGPASGEREASALRGDGDVRRGLGWPETGSAMSLLARRHAGGGGSAGAPRPPIAVGVLEDEKRIEHEGGIGWPEEPEPRRSRRALPDRSDRQASAPG